MIRLPCGNWFFSFVSAKRSYSGVDIASPTRISVAVAAKRLLFPLSPTERQHTELSSA
jgi:hypothetical protein